MTLRRVGVTSQMNFSHDTELTLRAACVLINSDRVDGDQLDGGKAADQIEAIVSIEPGACPAADGDLKPYLKTPILVLFGDYVDLSPRWAPRLATCRAFVEATRQAGGNAELLLLPEVGIRGNSHMLMHDSNSLELADLLTGWLAKQRLERR